MNEYLMENPQDKKGHKTTYTCPHTAKHHHHHTFNGPFYGTTQVSRYQKGKTNLDFTEARDSGISWAVCKSAPRSRQITTQNIQQNIYTSKYRPSNLTVRLTLCCPAVTNIENVDCGHWASLGMSKYDPQNCYIQWGSRPLPQTWLPWWWAEPPRVRILNGISLNGNSHPFSRARQPVQPVSAYSQPHSSTVLVKQHCANS